MTNNDLPLFYDHDQTIVNFNCRDNLFNLSSLNEFDKSFNSKGLAIKFVTEGTERYTIDKKLFSVKEGSYLLLNGEKDARVEIDSRTNVKGMCITIANHFISEVVSSVKAPDTAVTDHELATFFHTENFLENQYQSEHTALGRILLKLSNRITQQELFSDQINNELFFDLAEQLVTDQAQVCKQLQSIRTVKSETKRDLCRRVLLGKEYIDSHFTQQLTIEQIAQAAGMSEYHFFRLFKQMMGVSPYQYILSKRLTLSGALLKAEHSVSDTAIACGFSDIYSFSKAFKKNFGTAPSAFATFR